MRILAVFILILAVWSCIQKQAGNPSYKIDDEPMLLSENGKNASGAFFTRDHDGSNIIVWTEKLPGGEETGNIMKFARWNSTDAAFDASQEVESSIGCRTHDESMNKIAFKNDGTIVAVFSKRTPTQKNRFAGALYYTQSFDGGHNWTVGKYLHVGDTTHGLSRSFFDLATLPDGEVGAIWLDSRLTKERGDGSSLFFAKTSEKNGFVVDKVIGATTCECCRTDLFVSSTGNIHAVYRDIWQDTIRDMSIVTSSDNGATFSEPKRLSVDNWVINGCPHTGPSIAELRDELYCAWFTMGGGQGIFHATSDNRGDSFNQRRLLTSTGSHPQLITTENEHLIFVWDENPNAITLTHGDHGANSQVEQVAVESTPTSYIKVQVWKGGAPVREHWVSQPSKYAEFPVAVDLGGGKMGVAWVQNTGVDGYGIYFRSLRI